MTTNLITFRSNRTSQSQARAGGKISMPVKAATIREAMKLLGEDSLMAMQVFQNGSWVWAV